MRHVAAALAALLLAGVGGLEAQTVARVDVGIRLPVPGVSGYVVITHGHPVPAYHVPAYYRYGHHYRPYAPGHYRHHYRHHHRGAVVIVDVGRSHYDRGQLLVVRGGKPHRFDRKKAVWGLREVRER